MRVSLIDPDVAFASALQAACAPAGLQLVVEGPEAPTGELVIWNLTRHPRPLEALLGEWRGRAPARALLVIWDAPPEAGLVIAALRGGAIDALAKAPHDGQAIIARVLQHHAGQALAHADAELLRGLLERTYSLSLVNELLRAVNRSHDYPALQAHALEPLLELAGARRAELRLGDRAGLPWPLASGDPAIPAVLVRELEDALGRAEGHVCRGWGEHYVALFALVANGQRYGHLLISGHESLREQFEASVPMIGALCGQLAMAIGSIRYLEETRYRAMHDGLTGLYNHVCFQQRLGEEFLRARRYGNAFSVVLLDVDYFKLINDTYGHPIGDEALMAIGALLAKTKRDCDIAARYGGEEFVLILPETSEEQACWAAERLREAIAGLRVKTTDGRPIGKITATFGVAGFRPDDREPQAVLLRADEALYRAKRGGRNRICQAELAPRDRRIPG